MKLTFPTITGLQSLSRLDRSSLTLSMTTSIVEVLLLAIAIVQPYICVQASEIFNETLTIRPLRDGRVSTRFSFVTTLEHAMPRAPETLNVSDSGM